MKHFKRFFVFYASALVDLTIAFPMVLLVRAFWGRDLRWARGVLSCELRPESWALGGKVDPSTGLLRGRFPLWWPKGWYLYNRRAAVAHDEKPRSWGGTSIGHGQIFGPGNRGSLEEPSSVEVHEDHHTAQAEAAQMGACLLAHLFFIVATAWGHWLAGLIFLFAVWGLGGNVLNACGGWLVAVLNEHPDGFYRGSAHEIGAYAVGRRYAESLKAKRDEKALLMKALTQPKSGGGL